MAGVDGFEQVKEQRSFAGKSRIVLALLQVLGRMVAYLFQCQDYLQYQSLALESVGLAIDHAQAFAHHRFIEGNLFDRWWRGGQHRSARAPHGYCEPEQLLERVTADKPQASGQTGGDRGECRYESCN
jgi:hypothetical protein